jgi:hypothetical protein
MLEQALETFVPSPSSPSFGLAKDEVTNYDFASILLIVTSIRLI